MITNKILGCMTLLCVAPLTLAMQPMDDQSLSATTGQDGINIGIGVNKVQVNQISLIDKDGFSGSYNQKAGLVMAKSGAPVTVTLVGANNSPSLNIVADTDGGGNSQAFANLAISFANNITGLTLSPFSIYLAGNNSTSDINGTKSIFTGTTLNSDVKEILRLNNGIDINFVNGNSPKMNIQLGSTPQSHMIQFGGAIKSVCVNGCPIMLVSEDTGASFNLSLKATDTTNGFLLNGFYGGIEADGFVFGNTGTSSKLDASINNLMLGTAGQSNANTFNNLQNGSMGNIGAVGASVTDLKVKISGM